VSDGLLLCELHAHTTWSDGMLTLPELVDAYGRHGFDVLCVTDHVVRSNDPLETSVDERAWPAYIHELEREAERAERTYGLLVVPGLELTDNREDPDRSAHALAIGVDSHIGVEDGIVDSIGAARAGGAAIVAAHPYTDDDATPHRPTRRLARERDVFRPLVDRWELFNRDELFSWVAEARLPAVATGDAHRLEHVGTWKTLLACERRREEVVEFLRSPARAYLMPYSVEVPAQGRAAA
jgi:hypothetical protein